MTTKKILLYLSLLIAPLLTNAQIRPPSNFAGFVEQITDIIFLIVIFIFALTFLTIMWGLIRGWIIGGGDVESVEDGKKIVFAGIIALVIMSSLWGLLYMLQRSLF